MKLPRRALILVAGTVFAAGCSRFQQAMTGHTDVLARAAGHELRVDEAARLLSGNPQIPAEPQVVQALANLWVDYTLFATAAAEDSTLGMINLDRLVQPAREQAVLGKLAQRSLQIDTTFTEAELQQRWASEGAQGEIRARHILLRIPPEASPAQRDSVRQLAESLRGQAAGGADFAALARQHSADPGSAAQGGDLGFFGRGRMVAPFEEVAFRLQPGQVGPVVESPFGYHVIQVTDRRQPELGAQREEFRQFLVQRAAQTAEQRFVDSLATAGQLQLRPGGPQAIREIATQSDERLRGRAGERVLATYRGGELTAGEVAEVMRMQPNLRDAIPQANDEQLEDMLRQLGHRELLLREATARGIALTAQETESLRTAARQGIQGLLGATGVNTRPAARGDARQAAVEQQVTALVSGAVSGTRQTPPLGILGAALRDSYKPEINLAAVPRVVERLSQLRGAQGTDSVPGGR